MNTNPEISQNASVVQSEDEISQSPRAVAHPDPDSEVPSTLTPWEVKGKVDYMAQIRQFGTTPLDGRLIRRWESVTRTKAPHYIRRGLVFSHQDIDKILDCVEKGIPVYIYTGRGPSGESMHLGHLVPFKLARYLQIALNCIVIIQMSDDEKFLFKDGSGPADLDQYRAYSYMNAQDIIACGFDLSKTLIFSNLERNAGSLYFNNVLIMKANSMSAIKSTYGLGEILPESVLSTLRRELETEESKTEIDRNQPKIDELKGTLKKFSGTSANNLGQCVWPAFQSGPAFCTSFREIFSASVLNALKTKADLPDNVRSSLKKVLKELSSVNNEQSIMCLVPMAIDQAPYFRMARDDASTLKCPKPAVIHSEFLPGLQQSHGKMSTTGDSKNSTLFLNMDPKLIAKTIKSHAFSGGGDTLEEHRMFGGDIRVDICYQYLTYFLEDDQKLREIAEEYTSGRLETGQLKQITAELVAHEITEHQRALKQVTPDVVNAFFSWDRQLDIGGCYDRPELEQNPLSDPYTDYDTYGIDFDRTFGFKSKAKPQSK